MQETQVQSLGWENLLEKGMATHFSILVWKIPWTEEPGGLQTLGLHIVRHCCVTLSLSLSLSHTHTHTHTMENSYQYIQLLKTISDINNKCFILLQKVE